jgi:hypothetical protein
MQQITMTLRSGEHRVFRGPGSWEELTPDQYRQWARAVQLGNGDADAYALLMVWYGLRFRTLWQLEAEQRLQLLAVLEFTQHRPTRWMIPIIHQEGIPFVGPGDRLGNLTFGQFMFAESARQQENYLELVWALYKPRWRWAWTTLKTVDSATLDAVRINYLGCIEQLASRFPRVFRPARKGENQTGGSWLDIGLSLARSTNALGTFQELEKANLYLVLPVLESLLQEQAEAEKKLAELKRKR